MAIRDTGAEQLIKATAKRIFFAEGKMNASTQDIADAAGVTRTLVNYYFRSKDILFEQVFKEGLEDFGKGIDEVLKSDLPLRKKIEKFIDFFSSEIMQYPYRETFLISEINSHISILPKKEPSGILRDFLKEIQHEMDNGTVKKMKPINFMLNIFSLMSYPQIMKPMFTQVFEINDIQYEKLLTERKKMIVDILFN